MAKIETTSEEATETTMSTPRILSFIVGIIVILGIGYFAYNAYQDRSAGNTKSDEKLELNETVELPDNWTEETNLPENVKYKAMKKGENYNPTVVLSSALTSNIDNVSTYVDSLIAGTQEAIPSFELLSDEDSSDDERYTRNIEGTYFDNQQINIKQRLIVIDDTLYTMTGSYAAAEEATSEEIDQVFDYIEQNLSQ